jgi:serine/threonine protein kinase
MRRYEGTLDAHLKERRAKDDFFEIGDVARLSLDVVRALEILHDYKIIHRDVKSQNLFLNHNQVGNISHLTLSDFDSAKVVEKVEGERFFFFFFCSFLFFFLHLLGYGGQDHCGHHWMDAAGGVFVQR